MLSSEKCWPHRAGRQQWLTARSSAPCIRADWGLAHTQRLLAPHRRSSGSGIIRACRMSSVAFCTKFLTMIWSFSCSVGGPLCWSEESGNGGRGKPLGVVIGVYTLDLLLGDVRVASSESYKKTTHTPGRTADRTQNKGRTEQSQVQRHSAEEAGRDSSMGTTELSCRFQFGGVLAMHIHMHCSFSIVSWFIKQGPSTSSHYRENSSSQAQSEPMLSRRWT